MTSSEVEDGMVEEIAEATGVEQATPGMASLSFVVAIEEEPVPPLRLSAFGGEASWFVQAKHPKGDEGKIRRSATGMSVVQSKDDADEDEGREVKVQVDPDAAFLGKCLYGITEFTLPTNEGRTRSFDHSKGGNAKNREVYEAILYARDQGFRKVLEEYLDWVAGRSYKAVHDFEALGNAPGQ